MSNKRENARRYYLRHRQAVLEKTRAYYDANKDSILSRQRSAYADNPEPKKTSAARYRELHIDDCRARSRTRWAQHKAHDAAMKKQWYGKHKEHVLERCRQWVLNNPIKRKDAARKYSKKARLQLADAYVRGLISQNSLLTPADIPQALVEIRRLIVESRRICHGKL